MKEHENEASGLLNSLITAIIYEMPLEARVRIADLEVHQFRVVELTQARYIRYQLNRMAEQGNDELLLKEVRGVGGRATVSS